MKRTTKATIALALGGSLAGSLAFAGLAFADSSQRGPAGQRTPAASASQAVASATLAEDLRFMREEERLARDVYAALAEKYDGAAPMANITNAEQRHFDAIGTLLARYGVDDPTANLKPGTYAFPALQKLYDDLMAQGSTSLQDAYDVGIAIEESDIADLEKAIARTTEADAKRVFENLLRGSEHHLAAFEAAKAGETVGTHDGSGMQNGRGNGQGNGGQGMGNGQGNGGQGMGNGQGNGPADGTGPANGAGRGMGPGTGDPADCPNS